MNCTNCTNRTSPKFKFRASIADSIGMLFFIVLFGVPCIWLLTRFAWEFLVFPFSSYRPEEDFTNNMIMFIIVSYTSSWIVYKWLVVTDKLKVFLKRLGYFWNYELTITHVCNGCGMEVKVDEYPKKI